MCLGFMLILCCILTGCVKKNSIPTTSLKKVSHESTSHKKTFYDAFDVERQEAALLDIAIPPYQQRLPLFSEDQYTGQVVLGYYSDCKAEDQRKFFHEQMERYGWNLRREFKGPELLLEFEKPTRSCAVSIRPRSTFFGKNGTDIVIYVEDSSIVY
jgi:hypothetical protein